MSNYKIMKVSPVVLIGTLAFLPLVAFAQPQQTEDAKVLAQAEAKIATHLKSIDPKMRYTEFKSERLSKYLPDCRVFRGLERNKIGQLSLFILSKDGEIRDFADEDQGAIAGFLRTREVKVKSESDATEFVKFFEELQGNTGRHDEDWKYTAEKQKLAWKLKIEWVGDSKTSIIMPPDYEVEIDEQGNFVGLKALEQLKELDEITLQGFQ